MRKLKNYELNRLSVEDFERINKNSFVIILDNIRSLNNIGSIFRTADAFLAEKIYLCGITACPPHRDIHKTALGATESVKWEYYKNTLDCVQDLKNNNYTILSIEQAENSLKLNNFQLYSHQKYAFVFGNEVKGVQQVIIDNSDNCIEIPQWGTKHSLNISVSVGIILWDYIQKYLSIS